MFTFTHAGRWEPALPSKGPTTIESLKVVSYNVWFDAYELTKRRRALLDLLEEEDADVVVLAEVTKEFLDGLLAHPFVREQYTVSTLTLDNPVGYDVVMLSALAPTRSWRRPLESTYGRRLWGMELETDRGSLVVAGAHLESGKGPASEATRVIQCAKVVETLAPASHAIFAGDMNFEPGSHEDERLRSHGYVDAWSSVHSGSDGFTRDTTVNGMAERTGSFQQRRIDHVYVRSPSYAARAIRLLGTEPLADSPGVWPSDHFGLCCVVARRGADQ